MPSGIIGTNAGILNISSEITLSINLYIELVVHFFSLVGSRVHFWP